MFQTVVEQVVAHPVHRSHHESCSWEWRSRIHPPFGQMLSFSRIRQNFHESTGISPIPCSLLSYGLASALDRQSPWPPGVSLITRSPQRQSRACTDKNTLFTGILYPSPLSSSLSKPHPLPESLTALQLSRTEIQWDSSWFHLSLQWCLSFLEDAADLPEWGNHELLTQTWIWSFHFNFLSAQTSQSSADSRGDLMARLVCSMLINVLSKIMI